MDVPSIRTNRTRAAFTLIELLLVIAILSILASIVVSSVNPKKQLGDARNAQRQKDIGVIMSGFAQYAIDHTEFQPSKVDGADLLCPIATSAKKLCTFDTPHGVAEGQCGHADIDCVWTKHLEATYLVDFPIDPSEDEELESANELLRVDYTIEQATNGSRITVSAPSAELNEIITATR